MNDIQIAIVAHYANKGIAEATGDYSQKSWYKAEQWQRDAAIEGVKAHLKGEALTGEQSHELWMKKKIADGWVWGAVKDANLKTHPSLVLFKDLSESEKIKNLVFVSIVSTLRSYLT